MNCNEFEIGWAELDDTSRLPAGMEDHRHACRRCSQLIAELTSILEQARELRFTDEPPQRVWVAVRNQLEQEGLLREPAVSVAKPSWQRPPAAGWLFRLPMGLAYTAVFFIAVGVMYLHSLATNPGSTPPLFAGAPQVPEMAWIRPHTGDSDQSVESMIARVPEEHRATFVSTWHQVNTSIDNLQSFIESHPEDPFAPQQLVSAFQQRERLRETFVGREDFQ